MNATANSAAQRSAYNAEVVVKFEPAKVAAPFFLRCGALLIDYVITIIVPVTGLVLGRYMGNDGTVLLNGSLNNAAWLIAILLAFTNFVVLPMFSGQTIGKIVTGLRIVRTDGKQASKGRIFLRQTLGYFLSTATLGIGFLIAAFGEKGRALHDYLAGTMVIYADRRTQ